MPPCRRVQMAIVRTTRETKAQLLFFHKFFGPSKTVPNACVEAQDMYPRIENAEEAVPIIERRMTLTSFPRKPPIEKEGPDVLGWGTSGSVSISRGPSVSGMEARPFLAISSDGSEWDGGSGGKRRFGGGHWVSSNGCCWLEIDLNIKRNPRGNMSAYLLADLGLFVCFTVVFFLFNILTLLPLPLLVMTGDR